MDSLTMYLNLKEALNPEKKSLIEEVVHVCSSNQRSKKGCKEAKVLIFRIIHEIIEGGTENSTFVMAVNNEYYSEENKEIREVDAWLLLNATIKLLSTDNYSVEEDKNFCENFLNLSKKSSVENFEQEIMQMINSLNDFYKSLVPLKRYVKFKEKLQNKSDLETDDESKNILECQECERTNYNEMRKKMQDKLREDWLTSQNEITKSLQVLQPDVTKILESIMSFTRNTDESFVLRLSDLLIGFYNSIYDCYEFHKKYTDLTEDENYKNAVENYCMYMDEITDIMSSFGVEEIYSNPGEEFDPHIHELCENVKLKRKKYVLKVHLKSGFRYKDNIIQKELVVLE